MLALHGCIHFMGFMKAFGLSQIKELKMEINRISGVFWLLCGIAFLILILLKIYDFEYFWLVLVASTLISQILIVIYWRDARYGTLVNLILLLIGIAGYFEWQFQKNISQEIKENIGTTYEKSPVISSSQLESLPPFAKKWLSGAGILDKPITQKAYLKQELEIRLEPDQEKWYMASAEQYFNCTDPGFLWKVDMKMNPFLNVVGRDLYSDGKGEMLMKMLSVYPMVNVSDERNLNSAALQRFLSEIIWFPSAALNNYISWQPLVRRRAKAIMNYDGLAVSGTFQFAENGDVQSFTTMRFKDYDDTQPTKWVVDILETGEFQGRRIPTKAEVSWMLGEKKWTWLKLTVTEVVYDPDIPGG